MYFKIDENGKIGMCSEEPDFQPGMIELHPPDDFIPDDMHNWKYVDGEFVYTAPEEPVEPEGLTQEERIAALEEELAAAKILLGLEV